MGLKGLTGFSIDLPGTYPDRAQGPLIRCIICLCDTRTVIIMKYELEAALALAGPSALLCSFSSAAMTVHGSTVTCQCKVSPCTRETVPLQMQLKCRPIATAQWKGQRQWLLDAKRLCSDLHTPQLSEQPLYALSNGLTVCYPVNLQAHWTDDYRELRLVGMDKL